MNVNFDRIIERRDTESLKWNCYSEDVLPLWVADTDFTAPEPVIQALHERVEHGIFGYAQCMPELIEVLRAWLRDRYDWEVAAEEMILVPGVMRGVNMTARAVGNPGDAIMFQPPVYFPFFDVLQNSGREVRLSELIQVNRNYEIDFDDFERAIADRARLFLLCNPHNPVGRVFTRAELERMAEICLSHNVIICSDEIHCDLVFSEYEHIPIATLSPEVAARTVTVFAPSKTFNIPGLACSVMVIQNPELREAVEAAGAGLVHGVNLLGQVAALAAYRDSTEWLEQLLAYLEANRDYTHDFVNERLPGIRMTKPEGTYLAWLDCRAANIPGNPHEFFLDEAKVALNDGETFGPGGAGFVRLNFGCPRATLTEALERMETVLAEI